MGSWSFSPKGPPYNAVSTAVHAAPDVGRDTARIPAARIVADGKFLRAADDARFLVKGVTYGTFAPDAHGYCFPPLEQVMFAGPITGAPVTPSPTTGSRLTLRIAIFTGRVHTLQSVE